MVLSRAQSTQAAREARARCGKARYHAGATDSGERGPPRARVL